jgi:hypothetical protein
MDNCLLPFDIILEITQHNQWVNAGTMARTCHVLLNTLTKPSMLSQIIDVCIKNKILYKWLTFAVPVEWLGSTIMLDLMPQMNLPIHLPSSFVTGGHVCQQIYHKQWHGDIDVFYIGNHDDPQPFKEMTHNHFYYEFVPTEYKETERCIENFDLSIVQQGYSDQGTFCTPLALYTYYYKNIIVIPEKKVQNYTGFTKNTPRLEEFSVTIWTYIEKHEKFSVTIWTYIEKHQQMHQGSFENCKQCKTDISPQLQPIHYWRARLQKYKNRFPDYHFYYCRL